MLAFWALEDGHSDSGGCDVEDHNNRSQWDVNHHDTSIDSDLDSLIVLIVLERRAGGSEVCDLQSESCGI